MVISRKAWVSSSRQLNRLVRCVVFFGAVVFGVMLIAPKARAAVPTAEVHVGPSVEGLVGVGENEYLFNFGVRFGWTLSNHVYIGAMLIGSAGNGPYAGYYGGAGVATCYNGPGYYGGCQAGTLGFTTGVEGGYDFAAGPVVVRPFAGLGFANVTYNYGTIPAATGCVATPANPTGYCYTSYSYTTSSFALWGGGSAIYDFNGRPWFVKGDVQVGIAPAFWTNQVMAGVLVGGGYQF
jgi:hypothetical protein